VFENLATQSAIENRLQVLAGSSTSTNVPWQVRYCLQSSSFAPTYSASVVKKLR
jgi:hypothetical protein